MTEMKIALSIEEAADYTGIGRNTLQDLVKWKKLPVLQVGRKVLIKTDILEQFMETNESVVPCYMGKPYTATTVNLMGRDIVLSLESINRELRKELGIELYVDVIPDFNNQVSAVQGFLKVRRCNIEWVELSGED